MSSTPFKSNRKTSSNHRNTLSLQRTEIKINVYDLLPPGRLSTVLWAIGSSLLHSGVVIDDREYAYGGHDQRGLSGVYWTKPGQEPPGGTFKHSVLHGFSFRPKEELDTIIQEASHQFLGTSYNLLTKNCNHFTSYLCQKLTNRPAPGWLNRAASIGVALPCVVPREWIAPPDYETADGELLDEDDNHETSSMLRHEHRRLHEEPGEEEGGWHDEDLSIASASVGEQVRFASSSQAPRLVQDTSHRTIPAAERAPLPRR